jgi:hypothetical protein
MNYRSLMRSAILKTTTLALLLVSMRVMKVHAQTAAPAPAWQGWAFVRLGGASSAPGAVATSGGGVLTSLGAGIAASRGMLLAMVRVTGNVQLFVGPGVQDKTLLVGTRSRGDHLFVAGSVGVARATAFETSDGGGTSYGASQTALAYDVSAHTDFRVAGLALAASGVVGPAKTSYVALTLGVELGWFGR